MNKFGVRGILGMLTVGILAVALGTPEADGQSQGPYPYFPAGVANNILNNGMFWFGGDSTYGVYSTDGLYSVWTFRDTFLTPPGGTGRQGIVGNTIAVVPYSSTGFVPTYYCGNGTTPTTPQAFFQCSYTNYRYWPNKSFFLGSNLYVILSVVSNSPSTPGQIAATDIARITNPSAPPSQWNITYFNLVPNISAAKPGDPVVLKYPDSTTTQPNLMWFGNEALTSFSEATDSKTYNLGNFSNKFVLIHGYYTPSGGDAGLSNVYAKGGVIAILVPNSSLASIAAGQSLINDPGVLRLSAGSNNNPGWTPGLIADDYFDISMGNKGDGTGSVGGYSVRYNSNLGQWQLVGVYGNGGVAEYGQQTTPGVFYGTSAIGPFPAVYPTSTLSYTFPQLGQSSTLNMKIPPTLPPDSWEYTTCYGIREWQINPSKEDDTTVYFTYTVGSAYANPNQTAAYDAQISIDIVTEYDLMYQIALGSAPATLYNPGGGPRAFTAKRNVAKSSTAYPGTPKPLRISPKPSTAKLGVRAR